MTADRHAARIHGKAAAIRLQAVRRAPALMTVPWACRPIGSSAAPVDQEAAVGRQHRQIRGRAARQGAAGGHAGGAKDADGCVAAMRDEAPGADGPALRGAEKGGTARPARLRR